MKDEKLLDMIILFLIYGKSYYDKKRGAFILEETPKEDTYIFSCTCDDVGFYVVYMENGENKTRTFLNNTKEYVISKRIFDKKKLDPQVVKSLFFIDLINNQLKEMTRQDYEDIAFKKQFSTYLLSKENIERVKQQIGKIDIENLGEELKEMKEKTKQQQYKNNAILNDFFKKTETQQNINTADDYYKFKRDKGKPKLLQVPVEAIQAISEIMDYGSNKYGSGFWDKVEPERYMQAAARHLFACQNDINSKDKESGQKHIKHALCNIAYVVALIEREESKNK